MLERRDSDQSGSTSTMTSASSSDDIIMSCESKKRISEKDIIPTTMNVVNVDEEVGNIKMTAKSDCKSKNELTRTHIAVAIFKASKDTELGLSITQEDDKLTLSGIAEKSILAGSELKVGSEIVSIDGKSVVGMTAREVINLLIQADENLIIEAKITPSEKREVDTRCRILGYVAGTLFVLITLVISSSMLSYVSWYSDFAFVGFVVVVPTTVISIIVAMSISQKTWNWLTPHRRCMAILFVAATGSFIASLVVIAPMILDVHLDDSYYDISEDSTIGFWLCSSFLFFIPTFTVIIPEIREPQNKLKRTKCDYFTDSLVGFSHAVLLYLSVVLTMPGWGFWALMILVPFFIAYSIPSNKFPKRTKISLLLNLFITITLLTVYYSTSVSRNPYQFVCECCMPYEYYRSDDYVNRNDDHYAGFYN